MALLVVWFCACLTPAQGADFLKLSIAKHAFTVEIAATPHQRAKGLSGRPRLPADTGMLFIFERLLRPRFWMQDTTIPLTIAFIDDDGRIVEMRDMAPNTARLHAPEKPVRYALEMRQGWFSDRRISNGAQVFGLESVRRTSASLAAPEAP